MRTVLLFAMAITRGAWCSPETWARPVPRQSAPGKPLRRSFRAGDETRYRVRLVVRSELEGPETVKIGAMSYVKIAQHSAQAELSWVVSERIVGVTADGIAQVREQLETFRATIPSPPPDADDAQSTKMGASLAQMLAHWGRSRTLEFCVGSNGLSSSLAADSGPKLDESAPPLLSLWLSHALRPQATLPDHPVRPGDSWQEPRQVHIAGWTSVHAGETNEWLEASDGERAALRLHVVQEISGRVLDSPGGAPTRAPEKGNDSQGPSPAASSKTERFYAESLNTLAIDDGRLLSASRSARKEIVQILPPAEGMPQPPRFRATLSVQVEIEPCGEGGCETRGSR